MMYIRCICIIHVQRILVESACFGQGHSTKHLVTSLLFVYFIRKKSLNPVHLLRLPRTVSPMAWHFTVIFLTGSEIPMFANISTSVACPNPLSCCKTLQFCAAVRLKPQFLAVKSPCLATYISILLGYRYKL